MYPTEKQTQARYTSKTANSILPVLFIVICS
jgi:hypothetical protein